MTERVQCAECADLYDSDEHPFCPRCGAITTVATPAAAVQIATRADPRRRRVQAAGVMMISTGSVLVVLALAALVMAPELVPETMETFAGQSGGDLELNILNGTTPAAGVVVEVQSLNGTVLATTTADENGTALFDGLDEASVRAVVQNSAWSKRILVPEGLNQVVDVDLSDPGEPDAWIGLNGFVRGTQVLSGVFAAVSLLTVVGGVAAVRMRNRNMAVAGAVGGGIPWIILFFASMNIVVLLVLALYVAAFVFLRKGRALFTS